MQEILHPVSSIIKICKEQQKDPDVRYRFSRHCIQIPCDDGILLYHTFIGSLILLEPGSQLLESTGPKVLESTGFRVMSETGDIGDLVRNWYLVPNSFDENKFADT